jgi:hypothetical protein
MLIRFLSLCFYFVFFLSTNTFAQAQKNILNRCEKSGEKTSVAIKTEEQGFIINDRFSTKKLNQRGTVSLAGDYVLGITTLNSKTIIDVNGTVWQDEKTSSECYAPSISIKIIFDPMEVFIGSDFLKGSCTYNTILEHEMEHVRLYKENLSDVARILRELTDKRFGGKPIYAPTGKARELLNKEIDNLWRPLIKSELAKVQIEQNRLDSEDEVAKVTWACLGELQSLFGYRFR